ncbi:MAG: radical SAM protein [Bacilli bacterium]|nr:radical SAM protein [Bacilli bacterium]
MRFKKIYIEITNICNLNCSFCSTDNRKLKEMTPNEFEIIINKIKNYTNNIYLHIKGEPLLHSNLEKILEIAKNNHINIRITTNGTLLKEKINILKNFDNIKQINISLHSENNKPNYFEDIFLASDILSTKIPIVYRIWTLKNNFLDNLSTTIVDIIINFYNLDDCFINKVIKYNNIKIKENIYLDKDNKFIWPNKANNNIKKNNQGTCLGTRNHIGILVNGDVVPCCLDSKGLLKLGNIFDESIDDIINNFLFKEINEGFKNHKISNNICCNCTYRINKFK